MNPRYRRALIPGLLVMLVVVVVVAALTRDASGQGRDTEHERVGVIGDQRIPESSALVVSTRNPRLAYTINDSGNTDAVYVVEIATGKVVGVTELSGVDLRDTEALAIDGKGRLWVADIGDNNGVRDDLALYRVAQPRRGDRTVTPDRFAIAYPDGTREDAEALLADPTGSAMYVVTKGFTSGRVYRLPARLSRAGTNAMRAVPDGDAPLLVTDGGFLRDGSAVVLRTYTGIFVYDPRTWKHTWSGRLPAQRQGESVGVEPGGRSVLVGTEGLPSPIERVRIGDRAPATPKPLPRAGGIVNAAS